mmetsp:Transcript_21198/g.72989  ORF Transcript_21198/g.72989 Transcript_21198/m.72989 type:complete len:137 (-) Transcript_21198:17-427(-)
MLVLRRWARDRDAMHARLPTFNVQNCSCFCESERPVVYSNITALMKAAGKVPKHSTDSDALRTFDCLVRSTLSQAFASAFGLSNFGYKHYVMLGFFANKVSVFDIWGFTQGLPSTTALRWALSVLAWPIAVWPRIF